MEGEAKGEEDDQTKPKRHHIGVITSISCRSVILSIIVIQEQKRIKPGEKGNVKPGDRSPIFCFRIRE